jgi:hypothetical protein
MSKTNFSLSHVVSHKYLQLQDVESTYHNFEAIGKPVAMTKICYKQNYNENSLICFYMYCWERCGMEIASLKSTMELFSPMPICGCDYFNICFNSFIIISNYNNPQVNAAQNSIYT